MCMYAYLLYIISQYWVRLRYLSGLESSSVSGLPSYFFFRVHRQLVVGLAYACRPKGQSVQSAKALRDRLRLCSVTSDRGVLSGRDAMLIILIKERQVWINRMQMRVRHIDLRVATGWAK